MTHADIRRDDGMRRCEPCLGMGYKGRYRRRQAGGRKVWKIEACMACGGTGQKHYRKRASIEPEDV